MIIKINKELEQKLTTIARRGKISKPDMVKKIMLAFIERYEHEKGPIMSGEEHKSRRRNNEIWIMYQVYKNEYFTIFGREYVTDLQAEKIDLRNIKLIKNKIMQVIIEAEKSDIIAIDSGEMIAGFEFFIKGMPDWWKKNSFTLSSICRNFEKILKQIYDGKRRGKNALDDFLNAFSGS